MKLAAVTWANIWVQATPGCAGLFVLSQGSGAPDPIRWATPQIYE